MQENTFEMKVGKVSFIVGAKNLEKGKVSVEEKLKTIMIKDLMAKDNAIVLQKTTEKVDFQGLRSSNESSKKTSKMA